MKITGGWACLGVVLEDGSSMSPMHEDVGISFLAIAAICLVAYTAQMIVQSKVLVYQG